MYQGFPAAGRGRRKTSAFRGNTVVDISPRNESSSVYPMHLRDDMKAAKDAPMKTVQRFVAQEVARW